MNDTPQPPLDIRRKRLKFRAWHRGTKELDLLIGRFADTHVDGFDEGQMDRFQELLDLPDVDVYNWLIGAVPVPAEHDHDVTRLLLDFRTDPRARS